MRGKIGLLAAGAAGVAFGMAPTSVRAALLFADTFATSTPATVTSAGTFSTTTQSGTDAPQTYTAAFTGTTNSISGSGGLKFSVVGGGTQAYASPNHDFGTDGATTPLRFTFSVNAAGSVTSSDFATVRIGDVVNNRNQFPTTVNGSASAAGIGILFRGNGGIQVFDDFGNGAGGGSANQINNEATDDPGGGNTGFPTRQGTIAVELDVTKGNATTPGTLALFVNGTQVPIGGTGGVATAAQLTYSRTGGFAGDYFTMGADNNNGGTENSTFTNLAVNSVPEPASLGMLAASGLGLLARRRRR